MTDFGRFLFDILGEIGGGRGESVNDLSRFSLAMVFWGALAFLAYQRCKQGAFPRERLLLAGFLIGFGRELFKLTVKSLDLYGHVSSESLEHFFPPIDHASLLLARVVVGASFLQYLIPTKTLGQRYLRVGIVAVAVFYLAVAPFWWLAVDDDPEIRFSMFWGDWFVHGLGAILTIAVIGFLTMNPSAVSRVVVIAFTMFFLDDALMLVNLSTDELYKTAFTPIRHNLHIWAIPVLAYTYLREQQDERDRLELQLRQAGRMEAVGQLSAGVAHDFNNLLQVISGYTELAQSKLTPGSDLAEPLENVAHAGDRAAVLVRQLLAFSRPDMIGQSEVDVNATITDLRPVLTHLLGPNLMIDLDLAANLPTIWGEQQKIEQILINLAVNARDAMPGGGTVAVETRTIRGQGDVGPGRILITVSDQGIGMDAETLSRVAEPFFTTKSPDEGTGLGLATVHSIVEECRGTIELSSTLGEGTTVSITLPARTQRTDTFKPAATLPVAGTVLVVEEEFTVRALIIESLSGAGYDIVVAHGARDALEIARTRPQLDIIVLADSLQDDEGGLLYETIGVVRSEAALLLLSSDAPVRRRDSDIPIIVKPFGQYQLLSMVQSVTSDLVSAPESQ